MAKAVAAGQTFELIRDADKVADTGKTRLRARQDGFRMDRRPGSIGSQLALKSRDRAKVVVYLERDGTTPAAEFGAKTHQVFGRRVRQRDMQRRTAAGWGRKGRLVGWGSMPAGPRIGAPSGRPIGRCGTFVRCLQGSGCDRWTGYGNALSM